MILEDLKYVFKTREVYLMKPWDIRRRKIN